MKKINCKKCFSLVCLALAVILALSLFTSCSSSINIDDLLELENFTAEFTISNDFGDDLNVNVFNDFTLSTDASAYSKYMAEGDDTVHLSDYEIVVREFTVSKSEVYYDMVIRHIASGDIIRTYVLDESNDYSYITSEGAEKVKMIQSSNWIASKLLDSMKGKSYKKNDDYPGYDYICEEKTEVDSFSFVYGVKLDENGNIIKILYAEIFDGGELIGKQALEKIVFIVSNQGTTKKP